MLNTLLSNTQFTNFEQQMFISTFYCYLNYDKTIDFVLNTLGASGLFIVCLTSRQYQSVIINAAWVIGGFYKYFS